MAHGDLTESFTAHPSAAAGEACPDQDLAAAVGDRTVIRQALGILMERHQLTEERAFAVLVRAARASGVTLRDIAQELVGQDDGDGAAGEVDRVPPPTTEATVTRPPATVDVAVLDDCPLVFHGVAAILQPYVRRVQPVSLAEEGQRPRADVTLWDPATTVPLGEATTRHVLGQPRYGQVVLYSMRPPSPLVVELLGHGCAGFVDKAAPAEVLVDAVLGVALRSPGATAGDRCGEDRPGRGAEWAGKEHGLTRREAEVLTLVSAGLTNTDISTRMYLSINTVKTYIRSAYRKLGFTRRVEAVRWGVEHGLHLLGPEV